MMVLPGKEEELHGRRSVWGSLGGLVAGGLHRHSNAGGLGLLRGGVGLPGRPCGRRAPQTQRCRGIRAPERRGGFWSRAQVPVIRDAHPVLPNSLTVIISPVTTHM